MIAALLNFTPLHKTFMTYCIYSDGDNGVFWYRVISELWTFSTLKLTMIPTSYFPTGTKISQWYVPVHRKTQEVLNWLELELISEWFSSKYFDLSIIISLEFTILTQYILHHVTWFTNFCKRAKANSLSSIGL